jgi:hypothetical protein
LKDADQGTKDVFTNIFSVAEAILWEKPKNGQGVSLSKEIRKMTSALGQFQLLNDCLFENYTECTRYYDDSLEKTCLFLNQLSLCDVETDFCYKNQNFQI